MKYALNEDGERVEAGPDATETAKCEACGWTVDLRNRCRDRNGHKTWFYRHKRGAPDTCPLRSGPPGLRVNG